MDWLIWGGATVSLIGLVGLILSIIKVAKARKAGLSDEELRAAVQRVVPLNMGSLFLFPWRSKIHYFFLEYHLMMVDNLRIGAT